MKRKLSLLLLVVMLLSTVSAFGATSNVKVKIPSFAITVNGVSIDNAKAAYPMLEYKGITYFPMTWDFSQALGLTTQWDDVQGLNIQKSNTTAELVQNTTGSNRLGQTLDAQMADFKIQVNGKALNNAEEEYPVLSYNYITYFPLTWRFAVEEFGWTSEWNNETGLSIASVSAPADTASAEPVGEVVSTETTTEEPSNNDAFQVSYEAPSGWIEAPKMITDDVIEIGAKAMDINDEQLALALKTRIAEMVIYSQYPMTSAPADGNPNMIYMVERNYTFDAHQTTEAYIALLKQQLGAFESIDASQDPVPYTNPNGIEFLKLNIVNNMAGFPIHQIYYITKEDQYYISFVITVPSTKLEELTDVYQAFVDSVNIQ